MRIYPLGIGGCIFIEIGLKIRFPITRSHKCETFFSSIEHRNSTKSNFHIKVFFNTSSVKEDNYYFKKLLKDGSIIINGNSSCGAFYDHNSCVSFCDKLIHHKKPIDLNNKLIPTSRHTTVKVFFINLFPFKFDK